MNACHVEGLAAFLDVVYNHIGPEGDYLGDCSVSDHCGCGLVPMNHTSFEKSI